MENSSLSHRSVKHILVSKDKKMYANLLKVPGPYQVSLMSKWVYNGPYWWRFLLRILDQPIKRKACIAGSS